MSGAMGSKKRRRKSGRPFIRLWRNVKRSEAYHGLSHTARAALIELLDRYNGLNNGMLGLGVRQLADELNCSKDTAARALLELDDAGLAPETQDRSKVSPVRHKTAKCPTRAGALPTMSQPQDGKRAKRSPANAARPAWDANEPRPSLEPAVMVAPLAWTVLHLTGSYDGRSKCGGRAGQHRSMT